MISVLRPNSSLYKELIKILINADKAGKDKLYMDFIKRPKNSRRLLNGSETL
jgi:hypothetical protein